MYGSVDPACPACGSAPAPLLDELLPFELHLADGVAELRAIDGLGALDAVGEVQESELVIEVQLVEQRGLEEVQIPIGGPGDQVAAAIVVVVLEEDRLEAGRFRDLQQDVLARGRLEAVEERFQIGLANESRFLDDDREPEIHGEHEPAEGPVVFGDEVVERGHDAVARSAFGDRVEVLRVQSAGRQDVLRPGPDPLHRVGLTEFLGDALGHVVEIAATVRPQHVVHDDDRERRTRVAGALGEHLQLVVDGEPVVVAVDERDVDGRKLRQHVVADVAVEDVAAGELLLVLGRVELRDRVDHVQLGVGSEPFQHERRGLAAQRADLDDPPRSRRLQYRPDNALPERIHRLGPRPLS